MVTYENRDSTKLVFEDASLTDVPYFHKFQPSSLSQLDEVRQGADFTVQDG